MNRFVTPTNGDSFMSSPHSSTVEELLARWESKDPGTPVRPVVRQAVDLGFAVVPPGRFSVGRSLRLEYHPRRGPSVTLHVDSAGLTAVSDDARELAAAVPGAVVRRKDVQLPFATVDPSAVLTTLGATAPPHPVWGAAQAAWSAMRGTGSQSAVPPSAPSRVTVVRAVVAALVLLLVVVGAATGGVPGVLIMVGLAALLVGLGALVVGRAQWALIASRAVGAGVLATGLVLLLVGGATAPATEPAANTAGARPAASDASPSAADVEAATVAAEAALLQTETKEAAATSSAGTSATGLLADTDADTAISAAQPTTALAALAAVPVQGRAAKTGYDRDLYGSGWVDTDRNGCDTRNDVLTRDLTGEGFKPGTRDCVVLTGSLADPYSGSTIGFQRGQETSADVQIDHVVALSNSWQTGAQGWDAARRTAFGNDPLNLLAVDGPLNMQKGDGDAATWLPPNKSYRCAYVARQVAVKVSYGLWMTQAERNAIATVLSNCPAEPLPGGVVAAVPVKPAPTTAAPAPSPKPAPPVVVPAPAPAPAPAPKPAPAPAPAPAPDPAPAPAPAPAPGVYYQNCTAVKAAGAAPIYPGDPGWQDKFDGNDNDGIGCES